MSMSTPDLDTVDDDLDTLDRGDTIVEYNNELTDEEKAVADAAKTKAKDPEPAKTEEVDEEYNDDDSDEDKKQNFAIRLNKALSQRDANAARIAALEAKLAAASEPADKPAAKVDPTAEINAQLEELYVKVEEARADGDVVTAAATQRKLDALNRDLIKRESVAASQKMTAQMQADAQHDAMVDILEERYPQLSKASETFDADLVSELNFQVTAYERMGMSAPAALRKAVKIMLREDPFAPADKAAKVEEAKPAVPAKKTPDIKQAIDLNKRQPPDASNAGVNKDDQKINVMTLSEEEFEKLPESKKRQLRGDDV